MSNFVKVYSTLLLGINAPSVHFRPTKFSIFKYIYVLIPGKSRISVQCASSPSHGNSSWMSTWDATRESALSRVCTVKKVLLKRDLSGFTNVLLIMWIQTFNLLFHLDWYERMIIINVTVDNKTDKSNAGKLKPKNAVPLKTSSFYKSPNTFCGYCCVI